MSARSRTPGLSDADRERLVKLCGMLGSSHDGERASAGLLASRLLQERGLLWNDVIGGSRALPPPPSSPPSSHDCQASRLGDVRLVLTNVGLLTGWEVGFVRSVAQRRKWSPKQAEVFERILDRVRAASPGGEAP